VTAPKEIDIKAMKKAMQFDCMAFLVSMPSQQEKAAKSTPKSLIIRHA